MESERKEITIADLERHSQRHGKKATSQLLALLGRKRPLYDLVLSKGGQIMFAYLIERLNELLTEIVNDTATKEERMEYKISVEFLQHTTSLVTTYKKYSDKLKGV